MRGRAIIVALVVAAVMLLAAVPAFAGQQTGIMYGLENVDVYEYTPTTQGTLGIEISWTRPDGTGAPRYPEAEVDGVVQTLSGEPYYDIDVATLYAGTNPQVGTYTVRSGQVDVPIYISVVPWIGDVPYRLKVTFPNSGTTVIDTGAINVANPAQKWAYGCSGDVFIPSTGPWHSVLQYWPGTMNRTAGTSDVWANWDDYGWGRDAGTDGYILANEWATVNYYPPIVSDATIATSGGPTVPRPNLWYTYAPEIWTAAARPNVWDAIDTDLYPKPGSIAYNAAPLWATYSWPDAAKADTVAYATGTVGNLNAAGHAFQSTVNTNATITHRFYGTSVTWVYNKSSSAGVAKVTIDGVDKGTVDLYNATGQFKQSTTFGGLTNDYHTIVIQSNKTKNGSSANFVLYHDAFVGKTDPNDPTPIQDGNTDGSTIHAWGKINNASANGGSMSTESNANAALAFTFTGTSIDYIYAKGLNGGIARVYIDGVDKGTVDHYAASTTWQQTATFSGLPAGQHTVLVVNNKTKNGSSGNYALYFDAFRIGTTYYQN